MKALLNRRHAINLSLIITLGLGPALTYLQAADEDSNRSADLVIQSLQAKQNGNIGQYKALLTQAKQNLRGENMTSRSQVATGHMIDQLIANPQLIKPGPKTDDPQSDLVRDNPQAREVLLDMSLGRSVNAAGMINDLMVQVTGKTGPKYDIADPDSATLDLMNPTVDLYAKVFAFFGLKLADINYDLSLIRRNDPQTNPDVLAEDLIKSKAIEISTGAGIASFLSSIARQNIPNKYLQAAGLGTSAYLMLNIDSQMMQDIAALYGQPIRDAHQLELYEMSVFMLAQIMSRIGVNALTDPVVNVNATQLGANLTLARIPQFAKQAYGALTNMLRGQNVQSVIGGGSAAAQRVANLAGIPADGAPVQPAAGAPVDPTAPPAAKAPPHRLALQAILSAGQAGMKAAIDGETAYMLTEMIGHAAMKISRSAAKKSQEERDKAFYSFMGGATGEQFVNLMILASQASESPVRDTNFDKSNDPRIVFIRNLAHAAHMCSAADINAANAKARALSNRAAGDISVYACAGRKIGNVAAYNKARANFVSFKNIMVNEDQITALRATRRSNRLKMLQQLDQFQWLDGYRDAKEVSFFRTARTLLGLDDAAFDDYFQNYDSHVNQANGPKVDAQSPTGFIVLGGPQAAPYTEKKAGITPSDAEILNADILAPGTTGQTTTTNTNTNTNTGPNNQAGNAGNGGTWPPTTTLPPTTPVQNCNPNAGACPQVPAPGATRSWLHIDNLQGV